MSTQLKVTVDADLKAKAVTMLKGQGVTMTAFITGALETLVSGEGHFINPAADAAANREAELKAMERQLREAETANDPATAVNLRHALARARARA